jgi:heptosyltransferase-1
MRVLIVRTGAMGDVLHALPAVAALRTARPDWEIAWGVDPRWSPLLVNGEKQSPEGLKIYLSDTKLWSSAPWSGETLRSVLGLRRALRAGRFDVAVDVQGTLRSAVIARFSGASVRVGFAAPREPLAVRFYTRTEVRVGRHVVEQNAALLGAACGVELTPVSVRLPHENWADDWAQELVGEDRVCLLAPGAGWAAKCWPAERFGALAAALRGRGYRVMVNAPAKKDPLADEVIAASGGAAERVICNVTGLIALMRRMALVVGGDSGPVHLAASLEIPLIALFGPTDPERNGPWGGAGLHPVLRHRDSATTYHRSRTIDPGLVQITVEDVLAAIERSPEADLSMTISPDDPPPGHPALRE